MAIDRVELAIECDDAMNEGMEVLALIVDALGLNPEKDVEAIVTPSAEGKPVLVAVLAQGEAADE